MKPLSQVCCTILAIAFLIGAKPLQASPDLEQAITSGQVGEIRKLMPAKDDINIDYVLAGKTYSLSPLMLAVATGQPPEVLRTLLQLGRPVDASNAQGLTALQISLSNQPRLETVKILLDAGANPARTTWSQSNALHLAACFAPLDVLTLLLKRPDGWALLKTPNQLKETPLHLAAMNPHPEPLAYLLQYSSRDELQAPNRMGLSPLVYTIRSERIENMRQLLKAGADPYSPINTQNSLGYAVVHKNPVGLAIVQELIRIGGETLVNPPHSNALPLHMAAMNGNAEIVRVLLAAGAGKKILTPARDGRTALHFAAYLNDVDVVKLLLQAGADKGLALTDSKGSSALLEACESNNLPVVALLLQTAADKSIDLVNLIDKFGRSPLHLAACSPQKTELVEHLLKAGANPFLKDSDGKTALDLAKENGAVKSIKLLEAAKHKPQ